MAFQYHVKIPFPSYESQLVGGKRQPIGYLQSVVNLYTNPSHVSSQQMLVLICLPRKDGKLRQKRRLYKCSNLGRT